MFTALVVVETGTEKAEAACESLELAMKGQSRG